MDVPLMSLWQHRWSIDVVLGIAGLRLEVGYEAGVNGGAPETSHPVMLN